MGDRLCVTAVGKVSDRTGSGTGTSLTRLPLCDLLLGDGSSRPAGRRGNSSSDGGGVVLGWLLRMCLVLAMLGVLSLDVFSLAYASVTTVDDAGIVANAAAEVLTEHPGDWADARAASSEKASQLGVAMKARDWWVGADDEVHVTVSRSARTICLHFVKPLRKYLKVRAVGTATAGH